MVGDGRERYLPDVDHVHVGDEGAPLGLLQGGEEDQPHQGEGDRDEEPPGQSHRRRPFLHKVSQPVEGGGPEELAEVAGELHPVALLGSHLCLLLLLQGPPFRPGPLAVRRGLIFTPECPTLLSLGSKVDNPTYPFAAHVMPRYVCVLHCHG